MLTSPSFGKLRKRAQMNVYLFLSHSKVFITFVANRMGNGMHTQKVFLKLKLITQYKSPIQWEVGFSLSTYTSLEKIHFNPIGYSLVQLECICPLTPRNWLI